MSGIRSKSKPKRDGNWWIARLIILGAIALLGGLAGYGIYKLIPGAKAADALPLFTIGQLRKQIDNVDSDILILLNERQRLAIAIGEIKRKDGLAVRDGGRESQVITRLQQEAKEQGGPLTSQQISDVWMTLMLVSKQAQ